MKRWPMSVWLAWLVVAVPVWLCVRATYRELGGDAFGVLVASILGGLAVTAAVLCLLRYHAPAEEPAWRAVPPPFPIPEYRWTSTTTRTPECETQTASPAPLTGTGARARRRLKRSAPVAVVLLALACSGPTSPCSGDHPRPAPCYWTATPRPAR